LQAKVKKLEKSPKTEILKKFHRFSEIVPRSRDPVSMVRAGSKFTVSISTDTVVAVKNGPVDPGTANFNFFENL
jgi:hypothetical protein